MTKNPRDPFLMRFAVWLGVAAFWAAILNTTGWAALIKNIECIGSQGWKSGIKVLAGLVSSAALRLGSLMAVFSLSLHLAACLCISLS